MVEQRLLDLERQTVNGKSIGNSPTHQAWAELYTGETRSADMSIYTSFVKKHMEENEAVQLSFYAAASIHPRSEFNVAATVANLT